MALTDRQKAWAAAWRAKNREQLRQYYRDWRATHRELLRERNRGYHAKHREKRKAQKAAYVAANRELVLARQLRRYHERYAERKAAGLCVSCGGGKEGKFVQCLECRLRAAQLRADKARARIRDGENEGRDPGVPAQVPRGASGEGEGVQSSVLRAQCRGDQGSGGGQAGGAEDRRGEG